MKSACLALCGILMTLSLDAFGEEIQLSCKLSSVKVNVMGMQSPIHSWKAERLAKDMEDYMLEMRVTITATPDEIRIEPTSGMPYLIRQKYQEGDSRQAVIGILKDSIFAMGDGVKGRRPLLTFPTTNHLEISRITGEMRWTMTSTVANADLVYDHKIVGDCVSAERKF